MQVILKTFFLAWFIFFFFVDASFASNKSAINKKIKNLATKVDIGNLVQYPNSTIIEIKARQVLVIDYSTGKILLEKNAHERMPPSSMTKIMTSYIIQEKINAINNINPVINNALIDTRIFYEKSKTSTLNPPQTLEQVYYRYLYNKDYKNCDHLIEYFWMPKYVNANDASARTLKFYNEKNTNKI